MKQGVITISNDVQQATEQFNNWLASNPTKIITHMTTQTAVGQTSHLANQQVLILIIVAVWVDSGQSVVE